MPENKPHAFGASILSLPKSTCSIPMELLIFVLKPHFLLWYTQLHDSLISCHFISFGCILLDFLWSDLMLVHLMISHFTIYQFIILNQMLTYMSSCHIIWYIISYPIITCYWFVYHINLNRAVLYHIQIADGVYVYALYMCTLRAELSFLFNTWITSD